MEAVMWLSLGLDLLAGRHVRHRMLCWHVMDGLLRRRTVDLLVRRLLLLMLLLCL